MTWTIGSCADAAPDGSRPRLLCAVLWEILGCAMFLLQAADRHRLSLPLDQRAAWAATPAWMNAAWGFAVVTGLAGAVMLSDA